MEQGLTFVRLAGILLVCGGAQALQLPRLHRVAGDAPGDWFGYAVAPTGDVDGDGVPDFLVGAHQNENFAFSPEPGYVRVFSGASGGILYTFTGDAPHWHFGAAADGGMDVDGDGVPDFLIGAYEEEKVRIHSGADGSILHTHSGPPTERDGFSVAWLSDLDGDGVPEYAVGAMKADIPLLNAGAARVYSGADHSLLHAFEGTSVGAAFGWSVRPAGDVDGDGTQDLIVGARGDSLNGMATGSATVHSGSSGAVLWRWYGMAEGDAFGHAVDGAGDVNGDGRPDLVVGAPQSSLTAQATGPGYAHVFSGLDGSLMYEFRGETEPDQLGYSVRGAGDLNDDGHADLLVGAPRAVSLGRVPTGLPGYVRMLSGRDGALLYTFLGDATDDQFGISLAMLADMDADGFPEFLFGACEDVPGQTRAGYAAVTAGGLVLSRRYCIGAANSAGPGALLDHFGSLSISENDFGLSASECPPQMWGLFFAGTSAVQIPFGDGFRCVGGSVHRLGVANTGPSGAASLVLDLGSASTAGGAITPGSTWHFQFWYRDILALGSGFNLTDALRATFAG